MKEIVLVGPALSQSGYGVHARQVAKWLLALEETNPEVKVKFELVNWGMTPWYVDPASCDGLVGKILQKLVTPEEKSQKVWDVAFQLQLPNEWNPFKGKYNVGMTAAVETDRCNPMWVEAVNQMQLVVVPSEFTKSVLENSGEVKTPIEVIPESWVEDCRTASVENNVLLDKLELSTDFNFLVVSQFTGNNPENDRKNIAYTLKWLMEQFANNPEVGVVLKTNFSRNTKSDRKNVMKIISQLIVECRRGPGPVIHVLHGHMTNQEVVSLYTHPKIKALISLTRGEGFGLPILEAATCGLPVISTAWSAHTEFLNKGKYVKVEYNLHDIHPTRVDNHIFMQGAKWAYPLEEDFKRKVKRFHSASTIPTQWAGELREKLLESHSPEAVEQQYNELLEKISA